MPASASPPQSPPVRTPGQQPSHPASATNRSRTPQDDRFALYKPAQPRPSVDSGLAEQDVVLRTAAYGSIGDCLVQLGNPVLLAKSYAELSAAHTLRVSAGLPTGLDQLRGNLALRLDLVDEAEQWFRTGLEWSEREHCPVEQGRNLQGLAEVAERRGEQQQAMEHLDRAGELFSRYGAKLYLDQVLAKKQILKA